jgi:outer membrane murein-binding lipoprotein Lpp
MNRLKLFAVVAAFTLIVAGILPCTAIAASESQSSIEQTFQKAKQDYLEKNMNSAAQQIQKSASFMKAKAAKASDKGKEALNTSAKELEKLADDVKKGTVTSVKRMEETFARAYVALASDSHIKSTESWTREEAAKAGDSLDSANKYLERSFAWAGQKIETSTKEAMKKSKELSLKLKEKSSMLAEDVGKSLKDTGNEIEKFGKRISPK